MANQKEVTAMPKTELRQVAENIVDYVCDVLRKSLPDPAERVGQTIKELDAIKAAVANGVETGVWEPVGLLDDTAAGLAGTAAELLCSGSPPSVTEVDDLREIAELLPGNMPVRVHDVAGHVLHPVRVAVWTIGGQQTVVLLPAGRE